MSSYTYQAVCELVSLSSHQSLVFYLSFHALDIGDAWQWILGYKTFLPAYNLMNYLNVHWTGTSAIQYFPNNPCQAWSQ